MRSKAGILCIVLGLALLIGAAVLYISNDQEDLQAQLASVDVLEQLVEQIDVQETSPTQPHLQVPLELLTEEEKKMPEKQIGEDLYIGYINMPTLKLSLPVKTDWDYGKLKTSPCRYSGSILGEDLVLMAHNYRSHFGRISRLKPGDEVTFTDMEGTVTRYQVVAKDVLAPNASEEMTAGVYDLTLFTCTYGGANRITVYCDMIV